MKTMSSENIKEIRKQMREINKSLKLIEDQEAAQETARNNRDYESANLTAGNEVYIIMDNLKEVVRAATNIGCVHNAYSIRTYHSIEENVIK